MVWGVLMSLWLPWIDHAKSFRQPFEEIGAQIPVDGCLGSEGLGEPQRGMLHYVTGIITTPVIENDDECAFMLKQTNHRRDLTDPTPAGWILLWQGGRPGELDEQFSLYERSEDDDFPTSVERSRELVQAG